MIINLGIIYLLLIISYCNQFANAQFCSGNGLTGCACNFIKACAWNDGKRNFEVIKGYTPADLKRFLPSGLEVFAKDKTKITEICEPGSIGIFYDCKNRIPLAATIVVTAKQYESGYKRVGSFKGSKNIDPYFQQNDDDYAEASKRIPCYNTQGSTAMFVEKDWFLKLTGQNCLPGTACKAGIAKSPVDRGHLVAAHYGLGPPGNDRIEETSVFTNAVPQFAKPNRGRWNKFEGKVILWARENCRGRPVHIIVGSIPSTFAANKNRFFGLQGFSDYFSDIEGYRVNVPAYLWTAACCYSPGSFTKSTFFIAKNQPGTELGRPKTFNELFSFIGDRPSGPAKNVKLFPQWPDCHDDTNLVEIIY
ncbi:endonuclease domain-containing 1 -like [Paramuricea clavata]|uniref:Endonuclease domain-containing 1 -like n=1 Tax=Paramuricea clavata TaxID=317549 RepID=A0A6S7FJA7_PARCT|nr:endonuclease domain-containing 1 -like [Paramuricea clavata]